MRIISVSGNDIEAFKKLDPLFMLARTSVSNRFILGGVVEEEGYDKPIALMICEQVQDTVIVQWLYVMEPYRVQGLGNEMMEYLIELAIENGISRLESYFVDTYARQQVTPADEEYFRQLGFINKRELLGEWLTDIKTILSNSIYEQNVINKKLVPFNMLSKGKQADVIEQILSEADTHYLYGYDRDYLYCDEDISCALIDDKGKVYGALLAAKKVELIMPVAFLAKNKEDARVVAYSSLVAAKQKYDEDLNVCIQISDKKVLDMVEQLLPNDRSINFVLYTDINRFKSSSYEQIMRTAIEYDFWNEDVENRVSIDIEPFLRKGRETTVTVGKLGKSKLISSAVIKDEISSIGNMDAKQLYDVMVNCRHDDCYGTFDNLPSKPSMKWFDVDLSCYLKKEDEIIAIILVNITKDRNIFPLLMYTNTRENGKYLLALIKSMCDRAVEKYSEDTKVVLRCYDELSTKMSEQVFGAR